jgi:hypothetical protein
MRKERTRRRTDTEGGKETLGHEERLEEIWEGEERQRWGWGWVERHRDKETERCTQTQAEREAIEEEKVGNEEGKRMAKRKQKKDEALEPSPFS